MDVAPWRLQVGWTGLNRMDLRVGRGMEHLYGVNNGEHWLVVGAGGAPLVVVVVVVGEHWWLWLLLLLLWWLWWWWWAPLVD